MKYAQLLEYEIDGSDEYLKHHLGKRLHFHSNQAQVFQRDP